MKEYYKQKKLRGDENEMTEKNNIKELNLDRNVLSALGKINDLIKKLRKLMRK